MTAESATLTVGTKGDPDQLRALADLLAKGYTRAELRRALGFSRATLYRRLAELRGLRETAARGA